jgi:hypothetical protein
MRTQRYESTYVVRPVPRVPDHFGAYTAPDAEELALAVYEVGNRLHSPEALQERHGREILDHLVTGGYATVETAPEGSEPLLVLTDTGWALGPWVRQ